MTWSSIRRSPIKKRPRRVGRIVLWRTGRVIEDAAGMATLRKETYHRAGGICECSLLRGGQCKQRVSWSDGQMHHIISRSHGGSDILDNTAWLSRQCHREITGQPKWTPNWLQEWTAA